MITITSKDKAYREIKKSAEDILGQPWNYYAGEFAKISDEPSEYRTAVKFYHPSGETKWISISDETFRKVKQIIAENE